MKRMFRIIISKIVSLVRIWEYVDYETTDSSIRKNIAFKGPNVIILACAIVIASVGLNVNSIPVIIGAMLISPVMGPILGFGLGLGTEDNALIKYSLKNFVVMVMISIIASSVYFRLSPLIMQEQTELLARTNPTIYDVLIALFGGFAGILETSRKEKGTVISGVAIATALMPPLCTVGYGISILEWRFIGGALYLFLINSIFISLATFLAVKLFKFPKAAHADEKRAHKSRLWYIVILVVIIAPSIYTAINMVKENNFRINAEELVKKNKTMGNTFIFDHKIEASSVVISLAGEPLTDDWKDKFYNDAGELGILEAQITIQENATIQREDISEAEIIRSVFEHNDNQIKILNDSIFRLNGRLNEYKEKEIPVRSIAQQIFAQYPQIVKVSITRGSAVYAYTGEEVDQILVYVTSIQDISDEDHDKLERWMKVLLDQENLSVINTTD